MPSQEPAVDDKDDDVDLPSEETGGSRTAPPPRNACPPPDHEPSLGPACHPKALSASMAASRRGRGHALQAPPPRAGLGGAGGLPGAQSPCVTVPGVRGGVFPPHRLWE